MSDFRISDPLLRKMVYAVGVMGIIAFGFYTFSLLRGGLVLILDVLTPFLAALLLAYILAPVVIHLQQHLKLGRIMGTLVLYLIIGLIFFLLLAFLIPTVLSEFIRLFHALKTGFPPLLEKLAHNRWFQIDAELVGILQNKINEIQMDYEKILSALLPGLKKMASGGLEAVSIATKGIFAGLGSMFSFFSFIIFVGIINFYFIVDWEKIRPAIRKMIPPEHRDRVFDILEKTDTAVGGFLRGQITVSAIVGSLFAAGLFALGFTGFPALRNYCILIGTASAIGGFIPYLGAVMGVTPAILIVVLTAGVPWSVKLITLGFVLLLFGAIQSLEGFVLQPKIVGKGAGLHPLAVMFALLLGAQFGIGGMIAAVPLACVIRVLIREFYWLPIERREAALNQ
ncbi:MAG: AI-2E family transporter [Desulfobacterales bacterium]